VFPVFLSLFLLLPPEIHAFLFVLHNLSDLILTGPTGVADGAELFFALLVLSLFGRATAAVHALAEPSWMGERYGYCQAKRAALPGQACIQRLNFAVLIFPTVMYVCALYFLSFSLPSSLLPLPFCLCLFFRPLTFVFS